MNRSNIETKLHTAKVTGRNLLSKASAVGTSLMLVAGGAMAQPDVAAVTTEIASAKTAGYAVLGAMILAVLGFAAWKLLRRAA